MRNGIKNICAYYFFQTDNYFFLKIAKKICVYKFFQIDKFFLLK